MDYTVNKSVRVQSSRFRLIRNCMFLSGLSVFAQLYLFQPMLLDLCHDFDITLATSSLAVSASTLGMALGLFVWAFRADRIPREKLMGISLIVSSVLTILSSFVFNFPLLLLLSFFKGFILSGVSAVALAYLSEEVDISIIGLAISLYLSGNTIGGMSGRVVGTLLAGWIDWRGATIAIGFLSLLLGVVFVHKIPHSENFVPRKYEIREKMKQMYVYLTDLTFVSMYIVAALSMGVFVSVYNYLSFLLESSRFGLPHYLVAMIFMMYVAGVAGSIIMGTLSDRHQPMQLLKDSIILMGIGILLLLVMQLWAIIIGLGILTFAFFSVHTMASRIVSINASSSSKSCVTSLYWLFYYAGSSIIGSLTGFVLVNSNWTVFVGSIFGLMILSFLTALLLKKRNKVQQEIIH